MIWDQANGGSQGQCADNNFVRFLAGNYYSAPDRSAVHFLDIGPGKHAPNTKWLEARGFTEVTTVDISNQVRANYHADISDFDVFGHESFDCVLDINTLCHVEFPPIAKIKMWLKPGGKFFSIAPTSATARGHLDGKGFCRCATQDEIYCLYSWFENPIVRTTSYPTDEGQIYSWVIECTK